MNAMSWRIWTVPLTLALATLLAAACGDDASDAAPVRTNHVDLPHSYRFEPAAIEVVAGSEVTWTNNDRFTHSVKVEDGANHDLERDQSVTITFDEPGEYDYVCVYHPRDMRGRVVVMAP
jgi:plastocyanin